MRTLAPTCHARRHASEADAECDADGRGECGMHVEAEASFHGAVPKSDEERFRV